MLKTVLKINKKKKNWQSGLGCRKPKSPSTLEREERDLRKRNSKPEKISAADTEWPWSRGHHNSEETITKMSL